MSAALTIMTIEADPQVAERYPGVSVRAVAAEVRAAGLTEASERCWHQAYDRWHEVSRADVRHDARVAAYRDLSRLIEVDPDRQAPSIQALIDRGLRGKSVGAWPRINPVVDAVNAVAVTDLVALGVFDADQLTGPVRMALSSGGEPFQALGTSEPTPLPPGRLVLVDDARVLSLFAHRDGVHQAVAGDTRRVLLLGCVVPGVELDAVDDALTHAVDLLSAAAS